MQKCRKISRMACLRISPPWEIKHGNILSQQGNWWWLQWRKRTLFIIHLYCPDCGKIAVETSVSRHNGGPVDDPLKPLNTLVLWCIRGFKGGPLSDNCTPDRCSYSSMAKYSCYWIGAQTSEELKECITLSVILILQLKCIVLKKNKI